MKHKVHPRKIICIVLLVAVALSLCVMLHNILVLRDQLSDTQAQLSTSNARVELYNGYLVDAHNAFDELQADNKVLQYVNDELQSTNDKLNKALSAYDHDFSVKAPTPPHYLDVPVDKDLQDYIWSLCCDYGIDLYYALVYAIMQQESNFVSDVVSETSDYGLMQINISNHSSLSERLGITDFLDPYQNVHAGIYMLANLLHRYDVPEALMAYNLGEGGAERLWSQGIHTTNYSKQVLDYYHKIVENI